MREQDGEGVPSWFRNSLAEEFHLLSEKAGFTRDQIRRLILNGVEASWLSEDKKLELSDSFQSSREWSIE